MNEAKNVRRFSFMKDTLPKTITVADLASVSNITTRRLHQLAEEGAIPVPDKGKLPFLDGLRRLFQWHQRDSEAMRRERLLLVSASRRKKEIEAGVAERTTISRSLALNTLIGALQRQHAFMRQEIELHSPAQRRNKLIALGVNADIVREFGDWDTAAAIGVIDKIEDAYAREGRQTDKDFTNENTEH